MKEIRDTEFSISCGKETDSFETLEKLCNEEAEKFVPIIKVPCDSVVCVPCWTKDYGFAELIGIERFYKDDNGKIVYKMDFSESTL